MGAQPTTLRIACSARRLPLKLAGTAAILSALHVAIMVINYRLVEIPWLIRQLFDLDEEQSFGTWFSVVILLFSGSLLLIHAREQRAIGSRWYSRWRLLGYGFLLLSIDELVGLHETLNTAMELSWVVPGAAGAALVGSAFIPFLRELQPRTALLFVGAGVLYLAGAIGVESATEPMVYLGLLDTLAYNLTTALEEVLEMGGVILFLHALLVHLASPLQAVTVSLQVCNEGEPGEGLG